MTAITRHPPGNRAVEWLSAALVFCIGLAIFYRDPIFSGFREITGDRGDARFYIFLLEHWYKVFAGAASMGDPPMFYPTTGVLGFADAEFAQAIPYSIFRFVGADPFLAFQLMEFTQNLLGFACMYALARYVIGAPWWLAAAGGATIAFSNSLYGQLSHAQMLTVNYYPAILLLLAGAGMRLERNIRQASLLAAAAGLAIAALLFTGYYMGFFFILMGGVVLLLYVVFDWRCARGFVARNKAPLAISSVSGIVALMVGLIPFFIVHLPVVLAGAKRNFAEVMHYAPSRGDLLNYGSSNMLWGWLPETLTSLSPARLAHATMTMPPTPVLVLGCLLVWLWLVRRNRNETKRQLRLAAALFVGSLALLAMTVNIGGTSGWWLIWKFVPGGHGLRVPFRIGIAVTFALVLALLLCGAALLRTATPENRRRRYAVLVVLALLIPVGQINLRDAAHLDRRAEMARLHSLPPPPGACRSFVAIDSNLKPVVHIIQSIFLQIDGMLIADRTGVPTINGYSSVLPPHWHMLRPDQRKAIENARDWIARHKLEDGVCVYDRGTNSWHIGVDKLR